MNKQLKGFHLLLRYIRDHIWNISGYGVIVALFILTIRAHQYSVEALAYGALLCSVTALIFLGVDFWRYCARYKKLAEAQSQVTVSLRELPEPATLQEQSYRELLDILFADKFRLVSEQDNKISDMLDYYTMWGHQIKTPIAASRVLLQLEESPVNKELSQELFKIEQYVEMVLTYLRMDEMQGDLQLQSYDLRTVISKSVKKYASVFIHKKISLNMDEIHVSVLTDAKWLGFVLEQVISNALKYTAEGSIRIYMEESQACTLVIADTGIGIRREDLPRIFEKGFTGYNGRMDEKSTGLGLYLCKKIMERLGHRITIEPAETGGTRVKLGLEREELLVD